MTTYNINFTDPLKSPIEVEEKGLNTDFSVNFPGRIKLEWGEDVNENLMHLLEHFAVDAESPTFLDIPDSASSGGKLDNPVEGQLWFNKTNNRLYSYDGTRWIPHAEAGQQYGANWGQINHGEQLPLPVSPSGYVFSYDECIWSVSPFAYFNGFTYVQCYSDITNSTVTMIYGDSSGTMVEGVANYLIVGIRGNNNLGTFVPPLPQPTPTPTPTPVPSSTPAPSASSGASPTPTPDPSNTPAPSTSTGASPTPDPSSTPAVSSTPDPSSTPSVSSTPDPSTTPSASSTPVPSSTPAESSLPPLSVSNGSTLKTFDCTLGTTITASYTSSSAIVVSGGSGDYTFTPAGVSRQIQCNGGFGSFTETITVTDNVTMESGSAVGTYNYDTQDLSV